MHGNYMFVLRGGWGGGRKTPKNRAKLRKTAKNYEKPERLDGKVQSCYLVRWGGGCSRL